MRSRVFLLVAAAVAASVSVATAAGWSGGSAGRPAASAAKPGVARDLTDAEQTTVYRATQILAKRCMAKNGFRYWIFAPPSADENRDFPYVVDDVSWAGRHGYGSDLASQAGREQKDNPNARYLNGLAPADRTRYQAAQSGTPAGSLSVQIPAGPVVETNTNGCHASVERELYGDQAAWFRAETVVKNLSVLYRPKVVADQRYEKAVASWSRCMREAGRPAASPERLAASLGKRTEGMSVRQTLAKEIPYAVAEARCARSTSLSRTAKDLDRQYGDEVRGQYAKEIGTVRRMRFAALGRANKIVRAGR